MTLAEQLHELTTQKKKKKTIGIQIGSGFIICQIRNRKGYLKYGSFSWISTMEAEVRSREVEVKFWKFGEKETECL